MTAQHTPDIEVSARLMENEDEGTLDCGCLLTRDGGDGAAIIFCPTHAAAPALLEALQTIADSDSFKGGTWPGELRRIARGAVAAAEAKTE